MKLPKKWLCEYVDFNVANEEFIERMMWRGFELASLEPLMPGIEGVITGRIERIDKHPNADRLKVCQVNLGDSMTQILTNATNVFEGAVVPCAVVGASIRGTVFGKADLRGVDSYGMFCSGEELAITDADYPGADVDGILILDENTPLGVPVQTALDMDDVVFDFDLTPNRPDCASILGMCREAAAALGQTMREPAIVRHDGAGDAAAYASVTVENPALCPRYLGRVLTDIKIEPSPRWMQKKLRSVGLRPINNIVDITNFVLIEYGHPMHAFDLRCIRDGHIIVRNAAEGEVVTSLDDKQHVMDKDMLLIADPEKGVGIAGVMGGLNSEITDETKAVLYESAVFLGSNIRKTSRKLRMSTDAAARFIKGVEPVNAALALDRAVELTVALGAGKVVGDTIDVNHAELALKTVTVDVGHINRILNLSLSAAEMAALLRPISLDATPVEAGEKLAVRVPHYRTDIEDGIEADADVAEEIGRLYGYQNIPAVLMSGDTFLGRVGDAFRDEDRIKDTLVACGCLEMYNFNFTGPAQLKALRLPDGDERRLAVKILNPFGEEQSLMRTTLYIGMLQSVQRNLNRKTGHGRFMEVGNVHIDNDPTLPEERKLVGLSFFGETESFYTLKGAVEYLLGKLRVSGVRFVPGGGPYFQPGRGAEIYAGEVRLGEMGQMHPSVAQAFDVDRPVYMAELSFAALRSVKQAEPVFAPLPRFPIVERDLAVVVDEETPAQAVADLIAAADTGLLLENVALFDVYRGQGVPEGKKSLAFTFALRAEDHTLSEDEIRTAFEAVIAHLAKNGAPLRQ